MLPDDIPYRLLESLSTTIHEVLRYDEHIFSDLLENENKVEELIKDLMAESGPSYRDISKGDVDEWEGGDAEIVLIDAFYAADNNYYQMNWEQFSYTVKHVNRFFDVVPNRTREQMLDEFAPFFKIMVFELPKGTGIWRGRINPKGPYDTLEQKTKEIGPPPRTYAAPLRMNPAGISYFYSANNRLTCHKEIRPKDNDVIIYGLFETKLPLRLLDLSEVPFFSVPSIFSPDYSHDLNWAKDFLVNFRDEISKPINEDSVSIEYLPTQILSEYIRMKGFHGIRYASSLTGDYNYTLFCGPEEASSYDPWIDENYQIPPFTMWLKLINFVIENPGKGTTLN